MAGKMVGFSLNAFVIPREAESYAVFINENLY